MEMGPGGARAAWANLLGRALGGISVDAASPINRRGWVGILVVDGSVTVSVPTPELGDAVEAALTGLTARDVTDPDVVMPRLPPMRSAVGPVALLYPPAGFVVDRGDDADELSATELSALFAAAGADDLEESGMAHITSAAFGTRTSDGSAAAVSGYTRWRNGVGHLSVLTHRDHRQQGHGRRAAAAAIRRSMQEELLPQWRARPAPSQALARSLGLIDVGAQLLLEPA